ncbi:MAG: hypothetical protein ACK5JT_00535 [Hyphomicrobiaceae bacterium]
MIFLRYIAIQHYYFLLILLSYRISGNILLSILSLILHWRAAPSIIGIVQFSARLATCSGEPANIAVHKSIQSSGAGPFAPGVASWAAEPIPLRGGMSQV